MFLHIGERNIGPQPQVTTIELNKTSLCVSKCFSLSSDILQDHNSHLVVISNIRLRKTFFNDSCAQMKATEYVHIHSRQGFMQDTIIASHPCFGGHMDVNC